MKAFYVLVAIATMVVGCDSSGFENADSSELLDEAVLGGKGVKAAITAVNSSGWSGSLTLSRSHDGSLRWKISASGSPNALVSFCIYNASDVGPCFLGPTTNSRGVLRTGWRSDPSSSNTGDIRKWNVRVNSIVVATSGQVVVP